MYDNNNNNKSLFQTRSPYTITLQATVVLVGRLGPTSTTKAYVDILTCSCIDLKSKNVYK